jgi:hypothetical protein
MTRRLTVQIALGLAGAFALAVATPVLACDCDKKAGTTADKSDKKADKAAPAQPQQQAPAQEKKAEASKASGTLLAAEGGCKCGAKEAKDCKCGEKCHCTDKAGTKEDKPKTSAAASSTMLLVAADACPCGAKTAQECKCGEKCKCHEKKDAPPAPKAKAA